jgi:exosortase/archaeosortase
MLLNKVPPQSGQYIVYQNINSLGYQIISADQMVMAVLRRVYGPASLEDCERFVEGISSQST